MDRLDDITLDALPEVRERTEGRIHPEQILTSIGRKQGDTLVRLAEHHDVVEKTIRNWLDRFTEGSIQRAPDDEQQLIPPRHSKTSNSISFAL